MSAGLHRWLSAPLQSEAELLGVQGKIGDGAGGGEEHRRPRPILCWEGSNRPILHTVSDVCSVYRVASPQGTATVTLIRFDPSELKMNFKLRRSKQHCRVDIRWYGEPQGEKYTIETDTPGERASFFGVVTGECLWFENPIACLFEQ
ncbi:hypothetical protein, partial [Brevibacterium picturae]|uniref:hypothetical protein n=1 Tax=Brevibacterium picturae TaxID=260553 RepID=UPI0031F8A10B